MRPAPRVRRAVAVKAAALLLVVGGWAAAVAPVRAARVTGTVTGGPPPLVERESDGYGKFRRAAGRGGQPIPQPLIVILSPLGDVPLPPPPAGHPVMNQVDESFVPRALVVRTGATVDFLNSDAFYHNVFSISAPRKFDLGRYRRGVSRSVEFPTPGVVKLFCEIHPGMIGYILVTDSPFHASAGPDGDYEIDDVPPGEYRVTLWHERLKEPVAVTSAPVGPGAETRLDLVVPAVP